MARSSRDIDPMWTVMREGGPFHARFTGPEYGRYLERLKATGRERFVADLEQRRQKTP